MHMKLTNMRMKIINPIKMEYSSLKFMWMSVLWISGLSGNIGVSDDDGGGSGCVDMLSLQLVEPEWDKVIMNFDSILRKKIVQE
jgi:hypothetical protein